MNDRLNAHTKQNISFIHADNKKGDKVFIQDVPPTGVLAIHVKRCKILKVLDSTKEFSKRLPMSLYVRIAVGEVIKTTKTVNDVRCSNNVGVILDDLKHFQVTINNKLDDESNKLKIVLMAYQGYNKHKKLGEKEIHLFNIIKNLFIVETLELTRNAHVIGEVEIEMAFSYGCFGYGYSSQLESKTHSCTEQISQSLFYRAEPPSDRKHEAKNVMTAIPIPHPTFIKWPAQVNIVLGGKEEVTDSVTELMSGKASHKLQFPHLVERMSHRFPELQRQYSLQNKRSQRTTFLKNLVTAKAIADIEENQDEAVFTNKDSLQERERSTEAAADSESEEEYDFEPSSVLSRIGTFFGWVFAISPIYTQSSCSLLVIPLKYNFH
ncbi:ALS2CR11 [Bugula neritina]|uniref:ALS2CR11 n=1 Tax=Bugula neritina TaxID=10212 RepID=A0A7J7K2N3_BUGNE|nr:ALS2CR11 [Bugula neritina]